LLVGTPETRLQLLTNGGPGQRCFRQPVGRTGTDNARRITRENLDKAVSGRRITFRNVSQRGCTSTPDLIIRILQEAPEQKAIVIPALRYGRQGFRANGA